MDPIASYDVFDTLIARTVPHPHDIFSIVEKIHPYPRFKALRIEAERRSNGTIADIYKQFQSLTGESNVDTLRELEFKMELEHTIPIQTNIQMLLCQHDMAFVESTQMRINLHPLKQLSSKQILL